MTIYDIKYKVEQQGENKYFFSRSSMNFFKQTMRDFRVKKLSTGNYYFFAPSYYEGRIIGITERIFNINDNSLSLPELGTYDEKTEIRRFKAKYNF